ncbi:uncharacterized protein [Eulemur rufifrons]|uniref:uncharacterized protein n=1 Tax=Eulemur rufifrons TaxID=859984 RepID=UPI0037441804
MSERKLLFSKWRVACSVPGLQLPVQSVPRELQEDAGTEGLSQALMEQDFPPGGADLSECQEPIRSAASLSVEHEVSSVLDGAAPTQEACPQGPWSGDLSPCVSQVQAANTQLQPSTLVTDCLRLQLDQQWGRGCGFTTWSLPCQPWILTASADSGHQWLILPVLGFPGAQPGLPRLAQTVCPLLAGPSALKPRMSERKLLFSKWRVACSVPGLQLPVQSVPRELQEDAGTEGLSQALMEQDFPPGGADLSECQEPIRSAASLSVEHEVSSVLDGAAPTQEACPQGPWSGDLSPCVSQVQAANTQLQPSTLVTDCLRLQLDQQWGRGCGFTTWSLPCQPWILTASADSGHQWLILPVLGFPGAQPGLPQLAQTVCPLLAGPSALKPRMSERKLLFSKWRVACSVPGLQLPVQSVPRELQEDAGTEGLSQALMEQDFPPGGADLSECQEPIRSAASLSVEHEVSSVLDGAAPTQEACPQGPWSGDLSPCVSQVQAANTQLQPSTLVTDCLRLQLDQQWGRGCGFTTWSLPCQPWILTASADSGHQWLILPVLGFPGAQPGLPQLAQTVCPLLAGPSALKPRMSERKLLFSKWRVACSVPGLQLPVQRCQAGSGCSFSATCVPSNSRRTLHLVSMTVWKGPEAWLLHPGLSVTGHVALVDSQPFSATLSSSDQGGLDVDESEVSSLLPSSLVLPLPSVPRELQEDAGTEGLSQALMEQDFPPGGADLSECQEPIRSAASLSVEHEVSSVLDGAGESSGDKGPPRRRPVPKGLGVET